MKNGRDRGGRGRLIKDGDQAYNDLGVVVLSKREEMPSAYSSDGFTRLKHQSIHSLGQRLTSFKICSLHSEEQVMYDRLN